MGVEFEPQKKSSYTGSTEFPDGTQFPARFYIDDLPSGTDLSGFSTEPDKKSKRLRIKVTGHVGDRAVFFVPDPLIVINGLVPDIVMFDLGLRKGINIEIGEESEEDSTIIYHLGRLVWK